ncbi:MAG: hypothetical protein QOG09_1384 [Solirubrobacterales bacterium]|nr:hypothetical protein [Solirubrobacterales bacterium]
MSRPSSRPRLAVMLTSSVGTAAGSKPLAAAIGTAAAAAGWPAVLVADLAVDAPAPRPTVLAATAARELESALAEVDGLAVAARGHLCFVAARDGAELEDRWPALLAALPQPALAVLDLPPPRLALELESPWLGASALLLRVDLGRDRSLAALGVRAARRQAMRVKVAARPLGRIAARRALAGLDPGGAASARAGRLLRGLAGTRMAGESGQALPAALAMGTTILFAAFALTAIGGALTGKGRAQRAADLAAVSAVRSMRDDLPRLLAPPRLPSGRPNPSHLSRPRYLGRARLAALQAGRGNGVAAPRLRVSFPGASAFPPLRARVTVRAQLRLEPPRDAADARRGRPRTMPVLAAATAEASAPGAWTGMAPSASGEGGGYAGPLTYRQGRPMRPDVAIAFDRLASSARRAGLRLVIASAFRSDAEQARLFAAHPDPRWVAPPGRSLHRCATELDLGPPAAYGWLAANAPRFGFLRRYSWEAWHFGYTRGPPPCSRAASARPKGDGSSSAAGGLPSFVPSRFRRSILRSASRWNVSAGLLAAQLLAESNFNPSAVSPAGARGIAQFMPGTGRAYGLRNPFDAAAAIDAQAHLMSDLLHRFRSVPLALAAYNAGPGAVGSCRCVPGYPETRAYVSRILGLMRGAGEVDVPLEVRLVA